MKTLIAFLFTLMFLVATRATFAQVGPAKVAKVTKITSTTASPFVELSDSAAGKSYLLRKAAISIAVSGTTTGAQITITEIGTDRVIHRGGVDDKRIVLNNTTLSTAAAKVTAIKTYFLTP